MDGKNPATDRAGVRFFQDQTTLLPDGAGADSIGDVAGTARAWSNSAPMISAARSCPIC
jgi:hypothetical protein